MKKTVSVNIKGIHFIIEVEAFELLEAYLDRLKLSLKNQQGSEEIIEDIEIRIAELLQEKLGDKRQVVEESDVKFALDTLGDPAQFVDEDSESTSDEKKQESNEKWSSNDNQSSSKRLYRDLSNSKIAGVCSGIANYVNVDPVIIRFAWVISFLFFGFGFLLYIILWIVIPQANSSIDRLKMRGRPITVENVREEVENAAKNFTKSSQKFASSFQENGAASNSVRSIANFFRKIFAVVSILFGILFLILFTIFFFGGFEFIPAKSDTGFLSFAQLLELVLPSKSDTDYAWYGILLLSGSVILFLFISGFLALFNIKNKWSKFMLGGLFLTGIVGLLFCVYVGMNTGRDLAIPGEIEVDLGAVSTEQLIIEPVFGNSINNSKVRVTSERIPWITDIQKGRIYNSEIDIIYRESKDSNFHILTYQSAQARTTDKAVQRATNIRFKSEIQGSKLIIPTDYSYPMSDKFRAQDLDLVIEIPKNKTVLIGEQIIHLNADSILEEDNEYKVRRTGRLLSNGTFEMD